MYLNLILTSDQKSAEKLGKKWWKNRPKQVFVLSGGPGTGKSTIAKILVKSFGLTESQVQYCTFVGRAALNLQRKGVSAKTIHATCYTRKEDYIYDSMGNPILLSNNRYKKVAKFVKKDSLESHIKLLIVDEGGMVDLRMCADLESFGVPILVLGDIDQLPPIFGKNLWMTKPDIHMTQIMRQAADSPIIWMSDMARRGEEIPYGQYGKNAFVVDEDILQYKEFYSMADIILAGTNKTVEKINNTIRYDIRGYESEFPQLGDKLCCAKNNWNTTVGGNYALVNGLIGYVSHMYTESCKNGAMNIDFRSELTLEDDTIDEFENIPMDLKYLAMTHEERKEVNQQFIKSNIFTYGYGSTIHKFQGSEARFVALIDDAYGSPEFKRKQLFTGISRAKESICIVRKKPVKNFFYPEWKN